MFRRINSIEIIPINIKSLLSIKFLSVGFFIKRGIKAPIDIKIIPKGRNLHMFVRFKTQRHTPKRPRITMEGRSVMPILRFERTDSTEDKRITEIMKTIALIIDFFAFFVDF